MKISKNAQRISQTHTVRGRTIHLKGNEGISLTNEHLRGFIDAHHKHQLSCYKNQIIETGFTLEKVELLHRKLLNHELFLTPFLQPMIP